MDSRMAGDEGMDSWLDASMVRWMASPLNRWLNGSVAEFDGGMDC